MIKHAVIIAHALKNADAAGSAKLTLVEESVQHAKQAVSLDVTDGTSWCKEPHKLKLLADLVSCMLNITVVGEQIRVNALEVSRINCNYPSFYF